MREWFVKREKRETQRRWGREKMNEEVNYSTGNGFRKEEKPAKRL